MANRKKKVDNISKDDVSNEHKEFEETAKEALKLHDMLLRLGFKEIAEDALKIHDRLLEKKEEKLNRISGNRLKKMEKMGGALLQH